MVFETMREPFRSIAKLAALTLMRLSEIRLLRREHVHLSQGVVLLPRAKAGPRSVVLSAGAADILRQQLAATTALLPDRRDHPAHPLRTAPHCRTIVRLLARPVCRD